jgi:cytochrome c-type biogenesis protein CcmH
MTPWFVFALMIAAAAFTVLWPLSRASDVQAGSDLAVYRDQLEELDRDRAAGLIGETDAQAARVEISRRLIAAADVAEFAHSLPIGSSLWRRRAITVAAVVLLPLVAATLYLTLGSPELPGQPLARVGRALSIAGMPGPGAEDVAAAGNMSQKDRGEMIRGMVARLVDRLKENGNDVEGWQRLLRAYMVLGERDKAHAAAADAKRALARDPDKLRRIEDMIKNLGLLEG